MSIAHIATLGLAALSVTAASASSVESVVRAPALPPVRETCQ